MKQRRLSVIFTRRPVLILACAAALALLVPAGTEAQLALRPAPPLASVQYILHGLTVLPPNKHPGKGRVKESLYNKYGLSTAASQKASIGFKDGTILHINSHTDLTLRNPHSTYVSQGEVDEALAPGTDHDVETAAAVAAAIGTQFDCRVKFKKHTVKRKGKKKTVKKLASMRCVVVEGSLRVTSTSTGQSVVVKTGQQTTVTQNQAPAPPSPANPTATVKWTKPIPAPTQPPGQNIGLDANGGFVAAYSLPPAVAGVTPTPTTTANPWDVHFVNDGRLDRGWETTGATTDQYVVIGFGTTSTRDLLETSVERSVSALVIDPAATNGHPGTDDLREFQVRVSTTGTDPADFTTVYAGAAEEKNSLQIFTLDSPVQARYVMLYMLDNYGGPDGIDVAEMEVVHGAEPTPTPVPTNAPAAATSTAIVAGPTETAIVVAPTQTAVAAATSTAVVPPTATVAPTAAAPTATTPAVPSPTAQATNTAVPTSAPVVPTSTSVPIVPSPTPTPCTAAPCYAASAQGRTPSGK